MPLATRTKSREGEAILILGVDTCGPTGSVALARLSGSPVSEILSQITLEGRTYSATLVAAIDELLTGQGIRLANLGCIVVVQGPGSFTGVRVGLSAVKGLAEGTGLPVVAVSRLAVLAQKAGVGAAALDAHRREIFLRLADEGDEVREMLAGAGELGGISPPLKIAVCDDTAAGLLRELWSTCEQVRLAEPTAADALQVAASEIEAHRFADVAVLDGHYLRRSDAEIFGNTVLKS